MHSGHHLRQFLLLIFVLLIPCFAVWTVISQLIALPAIGLVSNVLTSWFPSVVQGLFVDGNDTLLMTEFGELNGSLVPPEQADSRLGFKINSRLISYSIPFYTALHFATQKRRYLSGYFWGIVTLYPLMALGLLCLCMKELMLGVGANFFEQSGVYVPHPNIIGICYQLSVLIVPTIAPALLWFLQSKDAPLLKHALAKLQTVAEQPERA